MPNLFHVRVLTRPRIWAAFSLAILVDGLQLTLGPLGWVFLDEALDVFTMICMVGLLGFHPLLLPSFLLEFLPVVDMLPTWTGCVALVVTLRHKRAHPPVINSAPQSGPIIDV